MNFQYYNANVKDTRFKGWLTVEKFIESIKNPKPQFIEIFNKIAECEANNRMDEKARLKENLYYFTPCVHVTMVRKYDNIISFTGLLVLDFDHIDNAIEFKEFLFNEYQFIICAWVSPSKKGVKALVKIPVVNSVDEFKAYYYGIGDVMEVYDGFDASGQNCVLPLFQSIDPDILFRNDYTTWTVKGCKKYDLANEPTRKPTPINHNDRYEKVISGMIEKGIDKISSYGHPQLRGLCISVGGYIANNYIDKHRALSLIDYKIETNGYLKKGIKGYQTTARWAIDIGMRKPLHLNID